MKQENKEKIAQAEEILERLKEQRGGNVLSIHKKMANDPKLLQAFSQLLQEHVQVLRHQLVLRLHGIDRLIQPALVGILQLLLGYLDDTRNISFGVLDTQGILERQEHLLQGKHISEHSVITPFCQNDIRPRYEAAAQSGR